MLRTPVPSPDFRALFYAAPVALLVLRPDRDFTIIDATEERLRVTMTRRENVVGRPLFEAFPDNPADPAATGVANLRASLQRVMRTKSPDVMALQKYDIPRPAATGGEEFEVRYWRPVNHPVLDADGELLYLIHEVEDVTAEVQLQRAEQQNRRDLLAAEQRYRTLVEQLPAFTYTVSLTEPPQVLFVSPQIARMGQPPEVWQADPELFWRHIHPDDLSAARKAWEVMRRTGQPHDHEYRFISDSGEVLWLRDQAVVVQPEGTQGYIQGILTDISEHKRMETELQEHRDRLERLVAERTEAVKIANHRLAEDIRRRQRVERALYAEKQRAEVTLRGIADAVISTDAEGKLEFLNPAAENLLRTRTSDALGRRLDEALPQLALSCGDWDGLVAELTSDGSFHPDCAMPQQAANDRILSLSGTTVYDADGVPAGGVLVVRDVTEERQSAEQLRYTARHDALTGLVNRAEFERRLEHAIASARDLSVRHALIFIDLDGFKQVNDTGGHAAGDELLRQLGRVMAEPIRHRDTLARMGGDEFACLLEHCEPEQAMDIAYALLAAVREYALVWEGRSYSVGASIGIVPLEGEMELSEALQSADAACYAVKRSGRNDVRMGGLGENEAAPETAPWLERLTAALAENDFALLAQPIVAVDDRHVHAYEVFLRLRERDELLAAETFMPIAERHRLAPELDRWVIRHALDRLAQGPAPPVPATPAPVLLINLSAAALADGTIIKTIGEALQRTGVAPEQVGFEVSERAVLGNFREATEFAQALKTLGCQMVLDDFTDGFSVFHKLQGLDLDLLKISARYVSAMEHDGVARATVDAANRLAHAAGIPTVAKFPDTPLAIEVSRLLNVDYMQGYLIDRPEPLHALHTRVRR